MTTKTTPTTPTEYREFFYYPVDTPFGKAWVLCQSDGYTRLTSSGPRNEESNFLTINNVAYTVHVDLLDYGNGHDLKRADAAKDWSTWHAVYSSRQGSFGSDKLTDSARAKMVKWVVPFMREWVAAHPYEVALGFDAGKSNDLLRAIEEQKKATKVLTEATAITGKSISEHMSSKTILKTLEPTKGLTGVE